jgi:hypothetical protein
MVAVLLSPAFLQHGAFLLFAPWKAAADNPYRISVSPGDIKVPRGSDQRVVARLIGFTSDRVDLKVRVQGDTEWSSIPMTPVPEGVEAEDVEPGDLEVVLLDLQVDREYQVEVNSLRSPTYTISVTDIPYVERIDLEYRFPAYTGLEPQRVEDGGDIAVLRGTEVRFAVTPTIPVSAGWLRIEDGEDIALVLDQTNGTWHAGMTVDVSGYYRVDLADLDGNVYRASQEMVIDALDDQPPIVEVTEPGRDVSVTKIEEVFVEVSAEDDYGLDGLTLVYSLNGQGEQRAQLYSKRGAAGQRDLVAGHTFFLEEYDLRDGDFLSYYVEAKDGNRFGGSQTATSDIYFVEVRPFSQQYRRAEGGGGGGGMGGDGLDATLSVRQREIVAATFHLIRDRKELADKEHREALTTVSLSQGRLREQVGTLIQRMEARAALMAGNEFQTIVDELRLAAPEMLAAETALGADRTKEALEAEQRALTHLQRAEASFRDVRVSFDSGGGGGGGQQSQLSEDLADLFELELDKLRNQYEMVQRGQEQNLSNEIDEIQQKLQELARRQQQEVERKNRLQAQSGGGTGRSQEQLTKETEELARQLERLARERSQPELRDTARRLQEAADAMRRANAGGQGQSSGQGLAAVERLEEARRLLDKTRTARTEEEIDQISQKADRVSELQQRIDSEVERAAQRDSRASMSGSELSRTLERKQEMLEQLESLEEQIDDVARRSRRENPDIGRALQEAANSIRRNQVKEKVRYSQGVVQHREAQYAEQFEEQISSDVEELLDKIAQAGQVAGGDQGSRRDDALNQARQLVERLESLESRLRERGAEGSSEEQGSESGEQGQAGEQERGQDGRGEQGEGEGRQAEAGEQAGQDGHEGKEGQGSGQGREGRRLGERPGEQAGGDAAGQSAAGGRQGSRNQGGSATNRIGSSEGGSFQPGVFGREELRQLDRELAQRRDDGRELREGLAEQGVEVGQLDEILRQMEDFDVRGLNNDPLALENLRQAILEKLRQFEFSLWRQLKTEGEDGIRLTGDDRVPAGYEDRVEEYFKALARNGQ